jgi:hypothetical protein
VNQNQNPLSQFIVDQLVVENRAGGNTYTLNESSVSPTRMTRGEDGVIREETICTLAKHAKFVDAGGNICTVALATGRVPSSEIEANRYEMITIIDQLRATSIPLEVCPYTLQFAHVVRGFLVPNPDHIADCGGHPDGCDHMRALIVERRKHSKAKWERDQSELKKLNESGAAQMLRDVVDAFGDVMNAHASQANRRAGLTGPGEV